MASHYKKSKIQDYKARQQFSAAQTRAAYSQTKASIKDAGSRYAAVKCTK